MTIMFNHVQDYVHDRDWRSWYALTVYDWYHVHPSIGIERIQPGCLQAHHHPQMFSDPKIWHKRIIVGIPYIPANQAWLSGKSTYSVDVRTPIGTSIYRPKCCTYSSRSLINLTRWTVSQLLLSSAPWLGKNRPFSHGLPIDFPLKPMSCWLV